MCGTAHWKREEVPDHKFDFIDVREYHTDGTMTKIKYIITYALFIKSFAVYLADIYTAINLLAFSHFNSIYQRVQDSPSSAFKVNIVYGRWIFAGCIIFSFLLLAYETHKCRKIVKSRDISYAYTNVMANNWYSLRSYDHFCFFCQINNSKKNTDEFAFFIFFTFKGWKRLLVADGPRQVINGLTLYNFAKLNKFSTTVYDYYQGNIFTAIMLLTMVFTVIVFAGSFLLLAVAALMYGPLLCYIKGNLKEFCCHKIDKRIAELVKRKKRVRLAKQAAIARKEAEGDFSHLKNKRGELVGTAIPQPTLPTVEVDLFDDSKPADVKAAADAPAGLDYDYGNGCYGEKYGYESPYDGPQRFQGIPTSSLGHGGRDSPYGNGPLGSEEYGSAAHLVLNAGAPGELDGYQSPSLPPSTHNSPDAHPQLIRGMSATPMGMHRPMSPALMAQMGPIGTSPQMRPMQVRAYQAQAQQAAQAPYGSGSYPQQSVTLQDNGPIGVHGRSPLGQGQENDFHSSHQRPYSSDDPYGQGDLCTQHDQHNDGAYGQDSQYPPNNLGYEQEFPDTVGAKGPSTAFDDPLSVRRFDLAAYATRDTGRDAKKASGTGQYLDEYSGQGGPSRQGSARSHANSPVPSFAYEDVMDDYYGGPSSRSRTPSVNMQYDATQQEARYSGAPSVSAAATAHDVHKGSFTYGHATQGSISAGGMHRRTTSAAASRDLRKSGYGWGEEGNSPVEVTGYGVQGGPMYGVGGGANVGR